ncbi:cupin-like domain-containing protein [Pseudomassariella vexata]|uniref:Cupin-like domain-domain-containing protein n=1 Tax=Pseudomassariella vexata TaxID=1141098 RepID=A0A1Y2DQV8_9PEZI|nr:cupin-like domain-containing protein [Pseudomassariella vexata]ORY61607.1 cupin-like domain-domain-containing protein [Pseudomassariella vexata]
MNPSNRKSLDEFQRWLYTPHKDPDIWLFSNEGAPFANAYEQLCLLTKPPLCYSEFATFYAQLGLLLKAAEYNRYQENSDLRIKELYIAQFPLEDLPLFLKKDLITPEIVKRAGKGDIYNTSIWLGLEPTFTPLHRDPNPNLFVQMASTKRVRLLPPARGKDLYTRVRNEIGGGGNPNIRGEEMMSGNERDALHKAVWGPQAPDDIQEAVLGPSDCLFIPNGWWHSVRSGSEDGGLNASVNWWFR